MPFLWLKSVNPIVCQLWEIPGAFEAFLNLKPTFLNMNLDFASLHVSDLISGHIWNFEALKSMMGVNLNFEALNLGTIDPNSSHSWVWFSVSQSNNLSSSVYKFFPW